MRSIPKNYASIGAAILFVGGILLIGSQTLPAQIQWNPFATPANQQSQIRPAFAFACGNGKLDPPGEQCDDGNRKPGDGCDTLCRKEKCGDGIVTPSLSEECDDKNTWDNDGCTSKCTFEYCGDAVIQTRAGEQCDDGNSMPGDGCNGQCKKEQTVNSVVYCCAPGSSQCRKQQGTACQNGEQRFTNIDVCQASCGGNLSQPVCGNSRIESGEQCDDGNTISTDGCHNCQKVVVNPVVFCCAPGSSQCRKQQGSACETGEQRFDNIDACQKACGPRPQSSCGDGRCEGGESAFGCDPVVGLPNICLGHIFCPGDCSKNNPTARCGNGIVEPGEQCDDGNTSNGDKCNEGCTN